MGSAGLFRFWYSGAGKVPFESLYETFFAEQGNGAFADDREEAGPIGRGCDCLPEILVGH